MMNTKTLVPVVSTIVFIILFSICFPTIKLITSGGSFYHENLGIVRCEDEYSCWHEIGHLVDDEMNWASTTDAFGIAMMTYIYYQIKYVDEMDVYTKTILGTRGVFVYSPSYRIFGNEMGSSPQMEVYANIFANAKGDIGEIPEILRPFYDTGKDYEWLFNHMMRNKDEIILLKGGTYDFIKSIQFISYSYGPVRYVFKYE
jgi:hypothetical protein